MNSNQDGEMVLEVNNLSVFFGAQSCPVRAVDGVSFNLKRGELLGLVGESGSGKSVTSLALAALFPEGVPVQVAGSVLFEGADVLKMGERELRSLRGPGVAYVFQEPSRALNPLIRAGEQVAEALRLRGFDGNVKAEVLRLFDEVGLENPERCLRAWPCQLSGGMQQRVVIAMALASEPVLLVADEPTTALDVTVQEQILNLLDKLRKKHNMAVLLITHNLAIVAHRADRVAVMYGGQLVEVGSTKDVIRSPEHPYTIALLKAVPRLDDGGEGRVEGIPGYVPRPDQWPKGCRFNPRCAVAVDACKDAIPDLVEHDGHYVRCILKKEPVNG